MKILSITVNVYILVWNIWGIHYIYQRRNELLVGSYRGTPSSFHDTINIYYDNCKKDKYIVFKNKKLCQIIEDIGIWYYPLRAIRSKETHYNNGIVICNKEISIYKNEVEYGKEHPANKFDLNNVRAFFTKFINDTDRLISMMDSYELS